MTDTPSFDPDDGSTEDLKNAVNFHVWGSMSFGVSEQPDSANFEILQLPPKFEAGLARGRIRCLI